MKKHIFSHVGRLLVFMSMFMSFFACQHDLQEPTIKNWPISTVSKVESAKAWFETYQKSDAIDSASKFKNMQPQWHDALVNGNAVEVIFSINGNIAVPSLYDNFTHLGRQRLVIYDKGNEGRVAYIYSYMPSKECPIRMKDVNAISFSLKGFDGMIAVYSLNDENLGGYVWEHGQFTKKLNARKGINLKEDICLTVTEQYGCGRACVGDYCGDLQCSSRDVTQCWDETAGGGAGNGDGGNGSGGNGGGGGCQGPFCNGNDDGGGGNGGGSGGGSGNDGGGTGGGSGGGSGDDGGFNPCLLYPSLCGLGGNNNNNNNNNNNSNTRRVRNIINELTGCRRTMLDNLITTNTKSEINAYLTLYSSAASGNVTFKETSFRDCDELGAARCSASSGSCIELNTYALQYASQEEIVATILHELLHVYMRLPGQYTPSTEQHAVMASDYIGLLKRSLLRVFPNLSDEDATALSWGGLKRVDYIAVMQSGPVNQQLPLLELNQRFSDMIVIHKAHINCNNTSCKTDAQGNCIGPIKGTACN